MDFKGKKYLALPTENFHTGRPLLCDIFIFLETNNRMIRLAAQGYEFDHARLSTYILKGVQKFYIYDPIAHPESYAFEGFNFNPELPEAYKPGAVEIRAIQNQGANDESVRKKNPGEISGEKNKKSVGEIEDSTASNFKVPVDALNATSIKGSNESLVETRLKGLTESNEETLVKDTAELEMNNLNFSKGVTSDLANVKVRGLQESADDFEQKFKNDPAEKEKNSLQFITGTKNDSNQSKLTFRNIGETEKSTENQKLNFEVKLGKVGNIDDSGSDSDIIGKPRQKKSSNEGDVSVDKDIRIKEVRIEDTFEQFFQIDPKLEKQDFLIKKTDSEVKELLGMTSKKIQDAFAKEAKDGNKEITRAEQFSMERMSFLSEEINQALLDGSVHVEKMQENPAAVKKDTYSNYIDHVKFLLGKYALSIQVAQKISQLRLSYIHAAFSNSNERKSIQDEMKPYEEILLKIAKLEDVNNILPKDILSSGPPEWCDLESEIEAPLQHMTRVVMGLNDLLRKVNIEKIKFSEIQKQYANTYDAEEADLEVIQLAKAASINPESIYYSAMAIIFAIGLGYNDNDLFKEIAGVALLKFNEKARSYPKTPAQLITTWRDLQVPKSSVDRDINEILACIEAIGSMKINLNYQTTAEEMSTFIESIPDESKPITNTSSLGASFLKLPAASKAIPIGRSLSLEAVRNATSWV